MNASVNRTKLREFRRAVEVLVDGGRWNREEFDRILALALEAAGGDGDRIGFLYAEAQPEWLGYAPELEPVSLAGAPGSNAAAKVREFAAERPLIALRTSFAKGRKVAHKPARTEP